MTLLHLENVTLTYPGATKPVLNQIHYGLRQGDFVILLGSNGSGKSSLLKLLHGHHQPTAGHIQFLGKAIAQHSSQELSRHVAVLTQHSADSLFLSLTVYENYLLMKRHQRLFPIRRQQERKFLQSYLLDFNPNLVHKLDSPINHLSGGEKQVLALAFCLLQPPALLLLDEHTSALDPKTSAQIMRLTHDKIKEHNITCLLTTHDLDIALQYGNRVLVLHAGKIKKIIERSEKMRLSKELLMEAIY